MANKKVADGEKKILWSVYIEPDLHKRFIEYCEVNGRVKTWCASEALGEWLEKQEVEVVEKD